MSAAVRARALTGTLVGAIAVVELRGPGAAELLRELGVARPPAPGTLLRAALSTRAGAAIDDVLVAARDAQRFEIGLHGGVAVREALRAELEACGAVWSEPGAHAPETLVARIDRAAGELAAVRPLLALAAQRGGALERELRDARERLRAGDEAGARHALRELVEFSARCAPFLAPRCVALVGPPNAGKSTLFNAVIGRPENTVDARAGSTVDPVMRRFALGDLTIDLWDTAGLDPSSTGLAARAAVETERRVRRADFVLWLSPRGSVAPTAAWRALVDLEAASCCDLGAPVRSGLLELRAAQEPLAARAALQALLERRWPAPAGLGTSRACAPDDAAARALREALAAGEARALDDALAKLVNDLGGIEH